MGTREGGNVTLASIIESLMKPLGFASKDNFSKIESLKYIEPLVKKLVDDAIEAGGPASMSGLKEAFRGFDALLKAKRSRG